MKLVMVENGPDSYLFNIFGANEIESVFPFFQTTETSCFRFNFGSKTSPYIKVDKGEYISSFQSQGNVYGLEILNADKQSAFEKAGGHKLKSFSVEFGAEEGFDDCGIYFRTKTETDGCGRVETDSCGLSTVALNNTSTETYVSDNFDIPKVMKKKTFHFKFVKNETFKNLYLQA
ncbi:hypothetical protein DH26_gp061 [Chloriridovirus anopheles1]|uniref:Uncharacterized protein n=1 Tax=Chloriridovirus anopheles1 TaxID=1465751 RepID=W8QF18_9VIRU|nr:hypothetical protein DH26_gp061 [Anopheles minimus iridovirus]AHL67554.1 hypothetical protein AMIV_061 [Anopheles minimus iridovirus]